MQLKKKCLSDCPRSHTSQVAGLRLESGCSGFQSDGFPEIPTTKVLKEKLEDPGRDAAEVSRSVGRRKAAFKIPQL